MDKNLQQKSLPQRLVFEKRFSGNPVKGMTAADAAEQMTDRPIPDIIFKN